MPRKRTKTKRQSLKTKYAVEKKVKEHNRKLRKNLRTNPLNGSKLKKDPGIPNLNPFKLQLEAKLMRSEKLIKMSHAHHQRRAAELAHRRAQTDTQALDEMRRAAAVRAEAHTSKALETKEEAAARAAGTSAADHAARAAAKTSRRAFFAHLHTVVTKADVVLEVLDARDPLACRAPEVEAAIVSAAGAKRLVLVLNKIDLVPPPIVQAWLRYLRRSFPTIAFKASTQKQRSHLAAAGGARVNTAVRGGEAITGSGAAGADVLMQLIKNYSRSHDKKKAVTVGVIGYPNVGKSSIINSLKRSRAVGVSPVPGFTKAAQEVSLDSKVRLLDCPGIIFDDSAGSGGVVDGGAGLLLRNCVSIESMEDPELAVAGILRRCEPAKLMRLYELPRFATADEFLTLVAHKRGKLLRGKEPDMNAAAKAVLQDWNSGAIPFFTVPPETTTDSHERAAIVTEWAKELDLDSLERAESVAVFGGPASSSESSSSSSSSLAAAATGLSLSAASMPSSAEAAHALSGQATPPEDEDEDEEGGDEDEDEDEDEEPAADDVAGAGRSGSSSSSSSSAAVASSRKPRIGWDEGKLEDRARRRAAAAAKPVRKAIEEEEAAVTMMASKPTLTAKKLRKERRRAQRAAVDEDTEPAPTGSQASSSSSSGRQVYAFDEFF